mmetsp:Transcript_50768/g.147371  ORF Transcript_50768/g.147371 Transcript_50768/m.147371 type:complete len:235 (-) Transcript_50768:645-1349(-)
MTSARRVRSLCRRRLSSRCARKARQAVWIRRMHRDRCFQPSRCLRSSPAKLRPLRARTTLWMTVAARCRRALASRRARRRSSQRRAERCSTRAALSRKRRWLTLGWKRLRASRPRTRAWILAAALRLRCGVVTARTSSSRPPWPTASRRSRRRPRRGCGTRSRLRLARLALATRRAMSARAKAWTLRTLPRKRDSSASWTCCSSTSRAVGSSGRGARASRGWCSRILATMRMRV